MSASSASLTALPNEVLGQIVDGLDYVFLNKLSQTCRLFRDLLLHDRLGAEKYRQSLQIFERSSTYTVLTKADIQVEHPEFPRNNAIVRTVHDFDALKATSGPQFVLAEGYLPCYGCYIIKRKTRFFRTDTTGAFALQGCQSTGAPFAPHYRARTCYECFRRDRRIAVDEILSTGRLTYKIGEWDERRHDTWYWVQWSPFGLHGWCVLACQQCKQHSWQEDRPSTAQYSAGKCLGCFTGQQQQISAVSLAVDWETVLNMGGRPCWCGCGYEKKNQKTVERSGTSNAGH